MLDCSPFSTLHEMVSQHSVMDSRPLLATVVAVLYVVYGIVWRLYWSPIAKFPGPKLAAVTLWYEFYYDVLKNGRYMWEIEKMHEKYGQLHYCLLQLLRKYKKAKITPRTDRQDQSV
jgi:hypothetical protein